MRESSQFASLSTLFWLYLFNAVLLIVHEIDSAYWKEWKLFHLPGGSAGFLILHLPLLSLVLYGLVLVEQGLFLGLMMSMILGIAGVFAFSIHSIFILRGHAAFKTPVSLGILLGTLLLSLIQMGVTVAAWRTPI
jgi:hypothetical protein